MKIDGRRAACSLTPPSIHRRAQLIATLVLLALSLPMAARAQGTIVGTVYDSLRTRAPLKGAIVILVESSRYSAADSHGRFSFKNVPAGNYTLSFMHPVLDSLDLQAPETSVDLRAGGRVEVRLSTPSPLGTYKRLCPGARDAETGVAFGRVRDVDDLTPLDNASVFTEWTEFSLSGTGVARHHASATARTSASGVFVLCGVPRMIGLELRAVMSGFTAGPVPFSLDSSVVGRIDFAISRRDSAARASGVPDTSASPPVAVPGSATITGVVRNEYQRPLPNARIDLVGGGGSSRSDSVGSFRMPGIAAGTRALEVRSLGFARRYVTVDLITRGSSEVRIALGQRLQPMKPITVLGRGNPANDRTGFEDRRHRGFGHYLTADDLARQPAFDLVDVLAGIPSLHLNYDARGRRTPRMRGGDSGVSCIPAFFLDGMRFTVDSSFPFDDLVAVARPDHIRGIEIYTGSEMIPPQYDRRGEGGCGSVVIWTR